MAIDKYEALKDLYLFSRNLTYKFLFDSDRCRSIQDKQISEQVKNYTMEEFRVLRDLIILLDENDHSDQTDHSAASTSCQAKAAPAATFKCKSQRFPDLTTHPNIWPFLMGTVNDLKHMQITPKSNNLTPAQIRATSQLQSHPDLEIKPADKGGNIVLMTKANYGHGHTLQPRMVCTN